jgi:aminoglycoside phosphotransferase family enzyme
MTGMPATLGALQEPNATTGSLNAQVRETHTGVVLLVGDKAYKAKKPLATDFLDFTTPELRERACEHEVARRGSTSDATPEIAAALAELDKNPEGSYQIDTDRPLAESVAEAQQICCLAT